MFDSRFDDIRPYQEHEINDAMRRIADSAYFPMLCSFVFPGQDTGNIGSLLRQVHTTRGFQLWVMRHFNEQVIRRTTTGFTFSGLEALDPSGAYLFVSNHRDIVLDSALLQYALYLAGHETTDITFGANLMMNQLVVDIGKSNKMFKVERATGARDFIEKSRHLSDFMREDITVLGRSVWIAQRNGRTKDGIDATDPGIIKMFCFSGEGSLAERLDSLSVVPVAVSYEWEPCDALKAVELCLSASGPYVKAPGEDLNSILTGITQPKGRVHFSVCRPMRFSDEPSLKGKDKNEFYREAAALIDNRIRAAYRLYPNNHIAADMLRGASGDGTLYTQAEARLFTDHVDTAMQSVPDGVDPARVREILLGIYANPCLARH